MLQRIRLSLFSPIMIDCLGFSSARLNALTHTHRHTLFPFSLSVPAELKANVFHSIPEGEGLVSGSLVYVL